MEKYRGEIIELFGEKLLLHERTIDEAYDLSDIANDWKGEFTNTDKIAFDVQSLLLGIKKNFIDLENKIGELKSKFDSPFYFFNRIRLKKELNQLVYRKKNLEEKLTTDYIYKNLGIGTLRILVDKLFYDLERQKPTNEKQEKVSREKLYQLVSHYSNMQWDDVKRLSVSEFALRTEQAFEMLNAELNGRFGLKTKADEMSEWEKAYNHHYGSSVN